MRLLGDADHVAVDEVLPGNCDAPLISERGAGLWPWAAPVRTLSVAIAATNRPSSERCGMSLVSPTSLLTAHVYTAHEAEATDAADDR